jgi:hypothetical protein
MTFKSDRAKCNISIKLSAGMAFRIPFIGAALFYNKSMIKIGC